MAEITSHNLHNVYTPRGAKMRSALAWSKHIHEALRLFGADTDVLFGSHHWPTWGNAQVREHLVGQRDLYRFLHDQTLRLANHGYGPSEIAETLTLPSAISGRFANRGYYGSVNHNVKAVYNLPGLVRWEPCQSPPPAPRSCRSEIRGVRRRRGCASRQGSGGLQCRQYPAGLPRR